MVKRVASKVGSRVVFDACATFLERIGITVKIDLDANGFLPGVRIKGRTILVREASDKLAGDVLHEAGHIAVMPSLLVDKLEGNSESPEIIQAISAWFDDHPDSMNYPESPVGRAMLQCGETEATAWSYAAAHAAGVDTLTPFRKGFDGQGHFIRLQFSLGRHLGIHGLAASGMTDLPMRGGDYAFPKMKRWLQI